MLYLVITGILKAVIPSIRNRYRIADLYGPGDVLGAAVLGGTPRVETAVAVRGSRVVSFELEEALTNRYLYGYLSRNLAAQFGRSRRAFGETELPAGARVAQALQRLGERFGQPMGDGHSVKLLLPLTHEELAALVGSSRVTVTRIIGELRREGAVEGSRGLYLTNPQALQVAADQYVMQVI